MFVCLALFMRRLQVTKIDNMCKCLKSETSHERNIRAQPRAVWPFASTGLEQA